MFACCAVTALRAFVSASGMCSGGMIESFGLVLGALGLMRAECFEYSAAGIVTFGKKRSVMASVERGSGMLYATTWSVVVSATTWFAMPSATKSLWMVSSQRWFGKLSARTSSAKSSSQN